MATYKAVTRIEYGDNSDPNNYKVVKFAPGDKVTGLPKETMKELWENGALEKDDGSTVDKPAEGEAPATPVEGGGA
jgi:hypothetical protein